MTPIARAYAAYNKRYFGNRLPHNTIVKWAVIKDAAADCVLTDPPTIRVDRHLRTWGKLWRFSLLHEMAHIASPDGSHGAGWQKQMHRLARIGAFDKLW